LRREKEKERERKEREKKREREGVYLSTGWSKDLGEAKLKHHRC